MVQIVNSGRANSIRLVVDFLRNLVFGGLNTRAKWATLLLVFRLRALHGLCFGVDARQTATNTACADKRQVRVTMRISM